MAVIAVGAYPTSMIAVRVNRYGGPDELMLEEIGVPVTTENEALVRVSAAGVGPWDALVRAGSSSVSPPLPLTPGADIAGVVEDPGNGASPFRRGDAIFGVTNPCFVGGYAQYASAQVGSIAPKPSSLSFAQAASVPVVAVTAWEMLFDYAKVGTGQTVVVHGAAGNVGGYAVQLARWARARVVAVAAGRDAHYVKGLGADATIDFENDRFEERVRDADVVVDTVGAGVQERSFRILKPGGIIVSSVCAPSQELAQVYDVRTAFFIVNVTSDRLKTIGRLIDDGTLQTDLGIVLPLPDARRAHEMLAGDLPHPRGKIVLDTTIFRSLQ